MQNFDSPLAILACHGGLRTFTNYRAWGSGLWAFGSVKMLVWLHEHLSHLGPPVEDAVLGTGTKTTFGNEQPATKGGWWLGRCIGLARLFGNACLNEGLQSDALAADKDESTERERSARGSHGGRGAELKTILGAATLASAALAFLSGTNRWSDFQYPCGTRCLG